MKYKLEALGETILINNVVHVGRINQDENKWFFNVLFISGVGISLSSDNKDEATTARDRLIVVKVKNDKEFIKLNQKRQEKQ